MSIDSIIIGISILIRFIVNSLETIGDYFCTYLLLVLNWEV